MPNSFSSRCMTEADWARVAPEFQPDEFKEPERMGFEFMLWLQMLRRRVGRRFIITSSFRSAEHNSAVHGAKGSAHMLTPCNAVDIAVDRREDDPNGNWFRWKVVSEAIKLGCTRIGIYPNGSLHLDREEGSHPAPRLWVVVDNPS